MRRAHRMRGAGIARWAVPLATLALLGLPAGAGADPLGLPLPLLERVPPQVRDQIRVGPSRSGAPFQPAFELKARDGSRVIVLGVDSTVAIEVTRGRRAPISAYLARGTVTPRRLEASFGKLGQVAMRFKPSPGQPSQAKPPRCVGAGGLTKERGTFVGDVRFSGEGDYISLHANRAKGQVLRLAAKCAAGDSSRGEQRSIRPAQKPPLGIEPDYLLASWRQGVASASFSATRFERRTLYVASSEESEGAVAKLRFAFAIAPSQTFVINNPLTFARLSPPAPFKGAATYRAAPDGTKAWDGALSLNFPGLPHFALAGAPFRAVLEAAF